MRGACCCSSGRGQIEQIVASLQLIGLQGEFRRDTMLEAFDANISVAFAGSFRGAGEGDEPARLEAANGIFLSMIVPQPQQEVLDGQSQILRRLIQWERLAEY